LNLGDIFYDSSRRFLFLLGHDICQFGNPNREGLSLMGYLWLIRKMRAFQGELANTTSWQIRACAEVICSKEVATATFPICQLDRRVCPTDIDKMHALAG
jgi:hypothetical protein